MPLSDVDRQLLIIQDVGDIDPATGDPVTPTTPGVTGLVFSNIGRLWVKYADIASVNPSLRDLYVTKESHDLVIARLESLVDISTNNGQVSLRLNQRAQIHRQQRDAISKDIDGFIQLLAKQVQPVIAAISITSPIAVPKPGDTPTPQPFYPDANSPVYSGSPYWRSYRRSP
jgi:hypothetical protein